MTETKQASLLRAVLDRPVPVFVEGDGVELVLDTGARVLDAASGVGVTALGYDNPAIAERMREQADRLQFVHGLRFESPVHQELADRVVRHTPGGLDSCYFVSGGSEALETAIKLCRQYWLERDRSEKWKVVGCQPSFHGSTLATLSAGSHQARRARHEPLLLDFPHIDAPNGYRGCGHCAGNGGCTLRCARELERVLDRVDPETVAAMVIEPIAGAAGGAHLPPDGYLETLQAICETRDVLLIADEVITGFGRTGAWFAVDHWQITPDVIAFAKGVSGGYAPLGGLAVRDEIVDVMRSGSGRFEHNFTMAGHPVACAAGCAVIDALESRGLPELVAQREELFFAALEPLRDLPVVGDIRGKGYLAGIELVRDRSSKDPFPPAMRSADRVAEFALEEGLLVYPCAGASPHVGDHLLVMPPLVTPPARLLEIGELLARAVERFSSEAAGAPA